jgi:hypothetical protein
LGTSLPYDDHLSLIDRKNDGASCFSHVELEQNLSTAPMVNKSCILRAEAFKKWTWEWVQSIHWLKPLCIWKITYGLLSEYNASEG